jgi:hypothetical protein
MGMGNNDTRTAETEMTTLETIKRETTEHPQTPRVNKSAVAYTVADAWVSFASRVLANGERPSQFSEVVDNAIWVELVNQFGERAASLISRRTRNAIRKEAVCQAKLLVAYKR